MINMNKISILALSGLLVSTAAQAAPTCDGKHPETCCNTWTADIVSSQGKWGAVTEVTYPKFALRVAEQKKSLASACQAYTDFHSDNRATLSLMEQYCTSQIQNTRCNEERNKGQSSRGPKEMIADLLRDLAREANRINKLRNLITGLNAPDGSSKGKNPYKGIGKVLSEYGKELADITAQAHRLETELNAQYGRQVQAVWGEGGWYFPSENPDWGRTERVLSDRFRGLRGGVQSTIVGGHLQYVEPLQYAPDDGKSNRIPELLYSTDGAGHPVVVVASTRSRHMLVMGGPAPEGGAYQTHSRVTIRPMDDTNTQKVIQYSYSCHDGTTGTATTEDDICQDSSVAGIEVSPFGSGVGSSTAPVAE